MAASSKASMALRERLSRRRTAGQIAEERDFVAALGRGLLVLESFADENTWQSSTDVTRAVLLPKATVSRLLQALEAMGYLHYSPGKRQYRLGTAVLALGFASGNTYSVGELVRPYLWQLAERYGVHAALGGRDQLDVVHLEVCHSAGTLTLLNLDVGSRVPLAGTATGHALIAALPHAEKEFLIEKLRQRFSRYWADLRPKIDDGLRQVEERGYTCSLAIWRTDINGVAVPFIRSEGSPLVLACGGPARHMQRRTMDEIGRRLLAIRDTVMERLRASDGERS